ncbi:MAG TPA: thioredoxin family protein [Opitutaceae bacterium]|jgi:thiol:disulfide interchange protein|nr:thioredoxin family protein [Opitutaceae bacterium]
MIKRSLAALAAIALVSASSLRADPEYPHMGPDIYDVHADGEALVSKAVATAAVTNKVVLVEIGANWCIWCRRMHTVFETDPGVSKALKDGYIVVMIDVNTRHGEKRNAELNARLGNPSASGIPDIVLIDSTGKQLMTKDTSELEEGDGYSLPKVKAFLAQWAPKANP